MVERARRGHAEALGVAHAEAGKPQQDVLLLHALGHHPHAQRRGDPQHRLEQAFRGGAFQDLEDDRAVDLDEIRPQAVKRFAAGIRAAGGGLSVDGFGRRLDSFEALEALRPDFVKVDGSITLKILKSTTAEGLLKAVLRVAASLRMGVVAECVEEQDVCLLYTSDAADEL